MRLAMIFCCINMENFTNILRSDDVYDPWHHMEVSLGMERVNN